MSKPAFEHDCETCVFLGHHDGHDLYYHPSMTMDTLIARYGDDGPDYRSGIVFAKVDGHIREAGRRAVAAGLISEARITER